MPESASIDTRSRDTISPVSLCSHRILDSNVSLYSVAVSVGKAVALILVKVRAASASP